MSKWTHSMCSECWKKENPDKDPVKVKNAPVEQCCFCGQPTSMGIYVRHDPSKLNCKH